MITAVAHVPDVGRCVTAELATPGNVVVLLGATAPEFAGSHLDMVLGAPDALGAAPQPDPDAPARYRRLQATATELVADDLKALEHRAVPDAGPKI